MENSRDYQEALKRIHHAKEAGATELSLSELTVESLPDELAELTRLQSLDLSWCTNLQNIAPLAGLTRLLWLDLSECEQIQELEPLSDLTSLQVLSLSNCRLVRDLAPLSRLTNLQYLNMYGCEMDCDLRPLSCLTDLQNLSLGWCDRATNLAPLSDLTGLQHLYIYTLGEWPDLTMLTVLTQLQSLALTGSIELQTPAVLTALTGLQTLSLRGCTHLLDLAPLEKLKCLQSLDLAYCREVHDFGPLASIKCLQSLDLTDCQQLQDLAPLARLFYLQQLNLERCSRVQDLSPLANLKGLKSLNLSYCFYITDVTPLAGLTNLQSLDLVCFDELKDLSPLADLANLQSLSLRSCPQVQDLSPLAHLTCLQSLDLQSLDQVQDLTPLSGLNGLQYLNLNFCSRLLDLTSLSTLSELKEVGLIGSATLECHPHALPLANWSNLSQLFATKLADIPSGLGSKDKNDNVLPRIRAWQLDLQANEAPESVVKLFFLGNGAVGKTQICRRLRDLPFDPSVPSTHGIDLTPIVLAHASGELPAVEALCWDFGGQDIYLGTHSLFLDDRAIYVIAWKPQETSENEVGEELTDDRPLWYWLEYVRSLAGPAAPVIVVQTQCDRELDAKPAAKPPDHGFERLRTTTSSAMRDDGMEFLQLELKSAARYLLERYGKVRLPLSWIKVGETLRERISEKTLPKAEFDALCQSDNSITVPNVVLEYLHRSGQVFYRKNVFGGDVVLDLNWALNGVYAVFERSKVLPIICDYGGRFTREQLALWVWNEYIEAEQEHFLSLMDACRICFRVGDGVYVAPALLPDQQAMAEEIEPVWRDAEPDARVRLVYDFLHGGVLSAMLSSIGWKAGRHGVYWAFGVCFYDAMHRSTVLITSQLPDINTGETGGHIVIKVAGGNAAELADYLVTSIKWVNIGRPPEVFWELGGDKSAERVNENVLDKSADAFSSLTPGVAPVLANQPQAVYVSYAWGDESERVIDEIKRKFPASLSLKLDKDEIKVGDWLSRFMQKIGSGELVLLVLSERYLQRPNCLRELFYLFQFYQGSRERLMACVLPLVCDGLRLATPQDRDPYVDYWIEEEKRLGELFVKRGLSFGEEDRRRLLMIKEFVHHLSDILAWADDVLMPRGADLFSQGIPAAISLLEERAKKLRG